MKLVEHARKAVFYISLVLELTAYEKDNVIQNAADFVWAVLCALQNNFR